MPKRGTIKKGSALILTMFILSGMIIVALSGSYVILAGIRSAGVQSQSVKAYFAAEAGAENLLWEMRRDPIIYNYPSQPSSSVALSGLGSNLYFTSEANYKVYFSRFPPLIFTSVGEYQTTKRSVEVEFSNN